MMKKKITTFAIIVIASTTFIGCKAKQEASKTVSENEMKEKKTEYRLIVSFISKGSGFDVPKRKEFLDYVESHPKKPSYKIIQWGIEGEADYCFTLSELSKKEQDEFVKILSDKLLKSSLIEIYENSESKNFAR